MTIRWVYRAVAVGALLALLPVGDAAGGDELLPFANAEQRERYLVLIDELRCPQCQNQNLQDSDAPLARDLRSAVFRLLQEGKSNREITTYLIDRYGDFITYMPRFKRTTYALWLTPLVLAVIAAVLVLAILRRQRRRPAVGNLDHLEQQRLDQLLRATDDEDARS